MLVVEEDCLVELVITELGMVVDVVLVLGHPVNMPIITRIPITTALILPFTFLPPHSDVSSGNYIIRHNEETK
jgi:hypothetical protein